MTSFSINKWKTVAIEPLSNVCFLDILLLLSGKFDWNASSWRAHAAFRPNKFFDASIASNSDNLSSSFLLYANKVHKIVASNNLLYPAAIWSLNASASACFVDNTDSLFISPLSCATYLSDCNSTICLLSWFWDVVSDIGVIYTEAFISPNSYIPDKKYGNVACLGIVVK